MKVKQVLLSATIIASLFLTGCDIEIAAPIDVGKSVNEKEPFMEVGLMGIDVPSCKDSKTGDVSDSVYKLQSQVPFALKGAKYIECKRSGFDSKAYLSIPMNFHYLNHGEKLKGYREDQFNIITMSRPDGVDILAYTPKKLAKSINRLINSQHMFKRSDISMSFDLSNYDSYSKISFNSVYVNRHPVQEGSSNINGGEHLKVKIPTLGLDMLLSETSGGKNIFKILSLSK